MSKKVIWIALMFTVCIVLYGQAVYAFGVMDLNLYVTPYICNVNTGISFGTLYSKALSSCTINSDAIFTGFICSYEGIVGDIFGQLLCGFMHSMQGPFWAMMTLYVTFIGIMVLTGQLPFTARDMVFTLFKIALVIGFATDPGTLVYILFKGLFAALQEGMFWVLSPTVFVTGEFPFESLLKQMDSMIADVIKEGVSDGGENKCSGGVITMMLSFLGSMPPLAMIAVTMMFKMFMVLARAVLGYLLAITGIMFLITLAPIFLSLSLFTITRSLFDSWVKFLISFVIQVVVVFAFIGFVISLDLKKDFEEVFSLAAPYSATNWIESVRIPHNVCTFCKGSIVTTGAGKDKREDWKCGTGSKGMAPFEMVKDEDFVSWISSKLLYLLFMAYLLEAILSAAPSIARHLSGAAYAPTLGGAPSVNQETAIAGGTAFGSIGRNFSSGFGRTGGALNRKIVGGARQAKNAAIGRGGGRSTITDIIRGGVGLR